MLGEIFGVDGIIVLVVVLAVLFGSAAVPKLARSLGSARSEFTKGMQDGQPSQTAVAAKADDAATVVDQGS